MPPAASVTLWSWTLDPPLFIVIDVAVLYWVGNRLTVAPRRTAVERRWRTLSFYAGLLVVVAALNSPLDVLSERLFWAHMVQHVLLLTVAPPLLILGRPWIRLWRPLPLGLRQRLGRSLNRAAWAGPLRGLTRAVGAPLPSLVAFCALLLVWHIPALFDATLRSSGVHVLEHASFFGSALLLWKQVIPSPPLRSALSPLGRVALLTAALVVSWLLAIVLALAPAVLYASYAHEGSRPGAISALADQHLAAGVMWVPGSLTLVIAIFAYVHRWLTPPTPARGPTGVSLAGRP